MKGHITLEVLTPDGQIVSRTRQPSRSITVGFMKLLYVMFSHSSWARQTIEGAAEGGENERCLLMAAPHGRAGAMVRQGTFYDTAYLKYPDFIGECFGIQISTDSQAVTPSDTHIPLRIGQGRARWRKWRVGTATENILYGVCSDRYQYAWLASGITPNRIYKKYLYGGSILDFATPQGDGRGLTFDGTYLWLSDAKAGLEKIYRLNRDTGTEIFSFAAPAGDPTGLAWDFDNDVLWHCDEVTDLIYKLDPANGGILDSFASPGPQPCGLEWYGGYLWNLDGTNRLIYKINPVGGAVLETRPLPPVISGETYPAQNSPEEPWGVMFDGIMWVISDEKTATNNRGWLWGLCLPEDNTNVELGGMEIFTPTFSGPNGSMVLRRCFINHSGGDVTIRKVGLYAGSRPEQVAADVIGTPVTITDSQVLRVAYIMSITV